MRTMLYILPYNYPLQTTVLEIAPALAAGNSIVLKLPSKTPLTATSLTDAITTAAGLPTCAFNFVPGRGSEIGDSRVDTIAMTGLSGGGVHVTRESGMTNLVMELDDNAPAIRFEDAGLVAAADACTAGAFNFGGQRCSAVSRVLAHESVHDEVVDRIDEAADSWVVSDPFDEETDMGPLIEVAHAKQVETLVEEAIEAGAELVRGGSRDGAFFEPTLLTNVPHDARIIHEEQFGPVVAVTTFSEEDEATELANAGELALDAAVFTADHDRAMRVANAVDAGSVRLNSAPSHVLGDVPFGGNKSSGINCEGIHSTIKQMLRTKSIILWDASSRLSVDLPG